MLFWYNNNERDNTMKYVILTDIHFGNKSNSDKFNQECLDFLQFVGDWCSDNINEDFNVVFAGDWNHVRPVTNNKTLYKYSTEGLFSLSNIGGLKTYMILGNHDLFYLDRRDVYSIIIPEGQLGIEMITEPIKLDDGMLLVPWLVGDENLTDLILEHSPEYVIGHFEIPSFNFNKKVKMNGIYDPEDYKGPKRIISGHFHLRQENNNITYIGNCFSHDYSDNNDWHNKGFAILDTETNQIQYVEWEDAPKYLVCPISSFSLDMIKPNMYLQLINDVNMNMMDVNKIKDSIKEKGQVNECIVLPVELDVSGEVEEVELENVSNINVLITDLLSQVESDRIDTNKLISIYNGL
jgi:hypothetical protein